MLEPSRVVAPDDACQHPEFKVNEIFYSLQGEGVRAGLPYVFIRFSGCNLACRAETHGFDCDTEFRSGQSFTMDQLLEEIRTVGPDAPWICLTGGEPGLRVTPELLDRMHGAGYRVAIETNGSVLLPPGFDWITVSPKVAEHAIRQRVAHEVKYVRGHGQGIPQTVVVADHYLISPAFNGLELDHRAVAWCVDLVKRHPQWRLSCQLHKLWRIR